MIIENLLGKLDGVKKNGTGFTARCPAHDDQHASLSIGTGEHSRILLKCFAGCPVETIVAALGLKLADLFEKKENTTTTRNRFEPSNTPGLTLDEFAQAKGFSLDFLKSQGISECLNRKSKGVRFEYADANGTLVAVRFRIRMTGDRFRWKSGSKAQLYGLWRIEEAQKKGYIHLVEGETDTLTLWRHNEPAIGIPGANTWQEDWADSFDGISKIYIRFEPDKGGDAVKKWLIKSRIKDRVHVLELGEYKDTSDFYLAEPETFLQRWLAVQASAVPFLDIQHAKQSQEAEHAWTLAKDLLADPQLLERIGVAMQARGYAGNLNPPLLAYLGLTSRLLERPSNQAFVSPSSAGKNRTIDAALELFPPDAFHLEKAGSARALVYTDEDFQHKTVVVAEADSIPEDGPAASAIRALAADNYMAYDVVEKNPKTGKFETRHIVKPGPTGLLTTSTKSLRTQMGTRVLEIPVPDDKEQTRAVMHAHAASVQPRQQQEVDLIISRSRYRAPAMAGACRRTSGCRPLR